MFTYIIKQKLKKTLVKFEGDLDIEATEIMEEQICPDLRKNKSIEIDFGSVSFVDSSGIGLLITLIQNLHETGSEVVISHLQPEVRTVFALLQLPEILGHSVFENFDGEEVI